MLKLRNRYIFAPIKTGWSDGTGVVTHRHLRFYQQRSRHVGAVIPEPFYLDARLRELPTQMGIDHEDKLPGLRELVGTIHEGGAAAIAHLNHAGRMANPRIPGNIFLSSTDKPCPAGGATPRAMTEADMDDVVALFQGAAQRALQAGFDAIELQMGHGYLLAQFLSPLVNHRDDAWGGDLEARARFPLRVLDAVRAAVDLPILVRVSGSEMVPGGIDMQQTTALARLLAQRGVHALHVSAGTVCDTPPWYFQHMFTPAGKTWDMAEALARSTGMQVVVVGRIGEVAEARALAHRFSHGYLGVGRALVADPDFVGKVLCQIDDPVRPCLACAEGCLGGVKAGRGLQCMVNPLVGREDLTVSVAEQTRRMAVVGGGLAGMQAAITLRDRGHQVDLYEPRPLGGQFNLAPLTPHKKTLERLVPYLVEELDSHGVKRHAQVASAQDLLDYDGVVIATGSRPRVPPIPGLDQYRWADLLADDELPRDQHVLIIGGGLIGVDIATALIPRGNRVTIVKRTTDFGEDMEMIAKKLSLKMMRQSGVRFLDHTQILRVDGRQVHTTHQGQPLIIEEVDLIVVSTGMQSLDELSDGLQGRVPYWLTGDARQVGDAQDAIHGSFLLAREL